jgi:hypothetical protein
MGQDNAYIARLRMRLKKMGWVYAADNVTTTKRGERSYMRTTIMSATKAGHTITDWSWRGLFLKVLEYEKQKKSL